MATYLLTVSYRGTHYAGWQRQTNALAVQQVLEEALADLLGQAVTLHGASRTDAGVHARGQAAHVELPRSFPIRGLVHGTNRRLPEDVRILAARSVPQGFHARKSARGKEYTYRLIRAPVVSPLDSWHAVPAPRNLDLGPLREATALLRGRHDVSAFALAGGAHTQPFRRIFDAVWMSFQHHLTFVIQGEGFLRGMVRTLVGTLLEVGRGKRTVEDFQRLLQGAPRSAAGPTAPAHGLELSRVWFDDAAATLQEKVLDKSRSSA